MWAVAEESSSRPSPGSRVTGNYKGFTWQVSRGWSCPPDTRFSARYGGVAVKDSAPSTSASHALTHTAFLAQAPAFRALLIGGPWPWPSHKASVKTILWGPWRPLSPQWFRIQFFSTPSPSSFSFPVLPPPLKITATKITTRTPTPSQQDL